MSILNGISKNLQCGKAKAAKELVQGTVAASAGEITERLCHKGV